MKDRNKRVLLVTLLIFCFIYLVVRGVQAAYESTISGKAENDIANWSIKVNNQEISSDTVQNIDLTYTVNDLTNIRSGKVAPGVNLSYPIQIDASGSEVAVKITFTITDKTIDPDKYLTLTSVTSNSLTIVKVDEDKYSAVIPKASLSGVKTVTLNMSWIDTGDLIEYDDTVTDDNFMEVNFNAIQYTGEVLTPYSG
ncbi:MAG: hypothetical protein IJI58_00505 [Bacilli bacterium]|nr:hypothetical protein [Bacilli bacterium]